MSKSCVNEEVDSRQSDRPTDGQKGDTIMPPAFDKLAFLLRCNDNNLNFLFGKNYFKIYHICIVLIFPGKIET